MNDLQKYENKMEAGVRTGRSQAAIESTLIPQVGNL